MFPREHGAWGMLALPFLSAAVLGRSWQWTLVPAAVAVSTLFCLREPLVFLGRQALIRKDRRAESSVALRTLALYLGLLMASGGLLIYFRPSIPLFVLGAAGLGLTVVTAVLTVHNRQRSVLLQIVSAAGLSASAFVAWLAVRSAVEGKVVWLWGLHWAFSVAAVLVVHARLDARVAGKHPDRSREAAQSRLRAILAQVALLGGSAACGLSERCGLMMILGFVGGVHLLQIRDLGSPLSLDMPLVRVGVRALLLGIGYSVALVIALW